MNSIRDWWGDKPLTSLEGGFYIKNWTAVRRYRGHLRTLFKENYLRLVWGKKYMNPSPMAIREGETAVDVYDIISLINWDFSNKLKS